MPFEATPCFPPTEAPTPISLDIQGNFVHRWHFDGGINYGFLLPNGNLLFRDRGSTPNSPGSDAIREIDWESDLAWEYRNTDLRRHCRLANGNNLFLCNSDEVIPPELTLRVQGGFSTPSDPERRGETACWRSHPTAPPSTNGVPRTS